MKKLQNNLYITRQGSYVHKDHETIVVEVERQKALQLPVHSIQGVYCFGNVMVSPFLMGFCGESGINLAFFTEYGRFLGRLHGRQTGNVLLRRAQYKLSEHNPLNIAKAIIAAKIGSSRNVLLRQLRNHGADEQLRYATILLGGSLSRLEKSTSLEQVRGIEGDAAACYFGVFNNLIMPSCREEFIFSGRSRRPPLDNVNALLSFLYSVFGNDISAALQGVGLDPQVGFLHVDRSGRDSLALDILEEFRAWLIDRLVLSLINRKQIQASDFEATASGAIKLKDNARKDVLMAFQARKQEEVTHPYTGEKVQIGLLPHIQALLLARHLRGDLEYYPAFIAR